jgi:hypothetical protein
MLARSWRKWSSGHEAEQWSAANRPTFRLKKASSKERPTRLSVTSPVGLPLNGTRLRIANLGSEMTKPRRGRSGLRLDDRRSIPSGVLSIHCPFPGIPPGLRPSSNFAHSSHRFQLAASSAFATSNVAAAPLGVDARGSGQNNPALCNRIPHERVMARTAAPEPRSPYGTFRRDEGGRNPTDKLPLLEASLRV